MSKYVSTFYGGLMVTGINSNLLIGQYSLTLTAKLAAEEFSSIQGAKLDFKIIVIACIPKSL